MYPTRFRTYKTARPPQDKNLGGERAFKKINSCNTVHLQVTFNTKSFLYCLLLVFSFYTSPPCFQIRVGQRVYLPHRAKKLGERETVDGVKRGCMETIQRQKKNVMIFPILFPGGSSHRHNVTSSHILYLFWL